MRYWTSDLHVSHGNIIRHVPRPFWKFEDGEQVPDVEAMDRALVDNWNDVVSDSDEVWVVGDVALSPKRALPVVKQMKGNKFLVPGNHDAVHRMHKKWQKSLPIYEEMGFTVLGSQETVEIAGESVLVCHFPYPSGDVPRHGDKYSGLRPDDEGGWLICGHVHSPWKVNGRMIHVGVDAHNYTPVPETWIENVLRGETEQRTVDVWTFEQRRKSLAEKYKRTAG